METLNTSKEIKDSEHTQFDALALSCRRLKSKGVPLYEIANRHGLSVQDVLSILSRNTK